MNRKSFLAELKSLLSFLDGEERAAVLRRYEAMFDAAGPEGEDALLKSFGSPVRQVLQIERDFRNGTLVLTPEPVPAEPRYVEEPVVPFAPEETLAPEIDEPAEELYVPMEPAEEAVLPEEPVTEEPAEELYVPMEPTEEVVLPEEPVTEEPAEELYVLMEPAEEAVLPEEPVTEEPIEELYVPMELAEETVLPEEPVAEEPVVEEPVVEEPAPTEPVTAEPTPEATVSEEAVYSHEPLFTMSEDAGEPVYMEEPAETPAENSFSAHLSAVPDEIVYAEETPAEENHAEEAPAEETPAEVPAFQEKSVGAGRVFGAILVTVPMAILGIIGFALALALGAVFLALGVVCCAGAAYCAGYVFGGVITFMPDILLVAGAMLLCAGLALLLLWLGIWLTVEGIIVTVRLIASVYRGILKKEGKNNG